MAGPAVVVEGDVDHAILKALLPNLDIPKPQDPRGREAAIRRAALAARQVGSPQVVLLLDRNSYNPEQLHLEVGKKLESTWQGSVERKGPSYSRGNWKVRLVVAGLPDDPLLKEFGITRYTSDDYLFKLLLMDEPLRLFCEREPHLAYKPPNASSLKEILAALAAELSKRWIVVDSSKRYVHLIRTVIGFEASRATLAEKLIGRCPDEAREQAFGLLRSELMLDLAV